LRRLPIKGKPSVISILQGTQGYLATLHDARDWLRFDRFDGDKHLEKSHSFLNFLLSSETPARVARLPPSYITFPVTAFYIFVAWHNILSTLV
jgi:hypothetical protein